MSSTERPEQVSGPERGQSPTDESSRPVPGEESAEPQQLPWWARSLLGGAGITLAVLSIWALMVNGREGAMPTTMIILGALLLLIALVGYLPDRLWAGDSGIQFARRAVRREIRAAAEAVVDSTPPDQRESVVEELVEDAEPRREEQVVDLVAALRASVDAAKRRRQGAGIDQASSAARSIERAWSDELLTASERARRMEGDLRAGIARAIPEVKKRTQRDLAFVESQSGDADLELGWPPNCRILVEAKLTTSSLAALPGIRRKARESGQRLGLLVLVGGSQSLSSLRSMQARLNDDIGIPVLVRPFEFLDSSLVSDLVELVRAVDGTTE